MGGEAMFDIEAQVTQWRNRLDENPVYQSSDVDELEAHLREEIINLQNDNLIAEEAFLLALHRIGDEKCLDEEYAKVNTGKIWRRRILWTLGGYFAINAIQTLGSLITSFALLMEIGYFKIITSTSVYILSLVQILLMAALFSLVFSKKMRRWRCFSPGVSIASRVLQKLVNYPALILFSLLVLSIPFWRLMPVSVLAYYLEIEQYGEMIPYLGGFGMAWKLFFFLLFCAVFVLSRQTPSWKVN
jgi:hypothetical protein